MLGSIADVGVEGIRDSRLDDVDKVSAKGVAVDEEEGEDEGVCAVDRPRREKIVRRREWDFIALRYNLLIC